MTNAKILWADDEIDLLKPHIMFLEGKGYDITQVRSGNEAVDEIQTQPFDIIFLDENMPGMTGLEALGLIKEIKPQIPVVMITKNEEEMVMEEAIGSQIADYLIKPINPNQILLSLKKLLENRRLVSEKVNMRYQQGFGQLSMTLNDALTAPEWMEAYKKLVHWSGQLEQTEEEGMKLVFDNQFAEANSNFCRFVSRNYLDWIAGKEDAPVMSHTLLDKRLKPLLAADAPVYLILIDNLRYDQWKALEPTLNRLFSIAEDDIYYSILPTSTQYARNAIFSGLLPKDIEKRMPKMWINDEEEGGKNLYEEDFLKDYLSRNRLDVKMSYHKITNLEAGRTLVDNLHNLRDNKLNVIVYNFIDLLSHVRTEMEAMKELAEDEVAYRSLTKSWFAHSPLLEIFRKISEKKASVLLTTDHGSVRVKKASKIVGDRNTTTNLRYKTGKNLAYNDKDVLAVKHPEEAGLPRQHVSSSFVFALEDYYFVYPNNYNYYVNYYRDTFQHGGISLEEMLVPAITLNSRTQ